MRSNVFSAIAMVVAIYVVEAKAEDLTIERLHASPSLVGPKATNVQISPDGSRVTYLKPKASNQSQLDLWEFNVATGRNQLLVDSQVLAPEEVLDEVEIARRNRLRILNSGIVSYDFSADGTALLFPLSGDIYYLPIGGTPRQITHTPQTETDARFSPRGRYISYVREQNLYIYDLETNTESSITDEGGGVISYATADFAAQEEMYRSTGYWWSLDDSQIAFTKIDEEQVTLKPRYEIASDGSVSIIEQRYPFAGTPNAVVELATIDLGTKAVRWMDLGDEKDIYLARVNWSPDGTLAVQRETRLNKQLDLLFFDTETGEGNLVLSEKPEYFVNLHSDLTFINGGAHFLWTSERTGFRQIYLYEKSGEMVRQVTMDDGLVAETGRSGGAIRFVDEGQEKIYFEGWVESPIENHLYSVNYDGSNRVQVTESGSWHQTKVSPRGDFFVDNGQSANRPEYTAVRKMDGTLLTYISENALDDSHPYYPYIDGWAKKEFGAIQAEDGTPLHYYMMKPVDFDPTQSYPVIIHVYGGPGTGQMAANKWLVDFNQYLARQGYIVFALDNRGGPNRGKAFEDVLYRNMGDYEVRDQMAGVNFLKSLPYVDGNNIGVYGGSYGGYMTLLMLMKNPGVFGAGIAWAPVVDWRLYDTHYTERYLGDPNDGDDVYARTSPISFVDNLVDPLFLAHGMADDNVFFDHSVMLIGALQRAQKPFDLMTYPGKRHRLTGESELIQFDQLRMRFFDRYLKD